ncbi:RNA-binding protein 7 [Hyla sarda]|uniref:RNA-binding protein 7 n=1 Tax=Hyla sarda TaxID=327740 RepID=UPI0024C25574|nr:RNA-binding protein 7 [Hyla sarda]
MVTWSSDVVPESSRSVVSSFVRLTSMGAAEADRTLFVGNLDPRATEELLFELFLQAGPAVSVKIPKDKDGNPKQFAFVNFKHEESVPYGMSLLNGIKLFGRPLKIQYRSGSSHASQDANNAASSPQGNGGFSGNGQSPNGNRYDYNSDMRYDHSSPVSSYQKPYSSPDSLQKQAMMNNYYRQGSSHGSNTEIVSHAVSSSSNYSPYYNQYHQSSSHSASVRYDSSSNHRKMRSLASHPYQNDGYQSSRDAHYRGSQEDHYHEGRSPQHRREPRWNQSRY